MSGNSNSRVSLTVSQTQGVPVDFAVTDSPVFDSFGRFRVSEPLTLFAGDTVTGLDTNKWETFGVGTGTNTYVTNYSALRITTGGTASGARSIRQSRYYAQYQPGRSQFFAATFVMGTPYNNSDSYVGYGDDDNGIFLKRSTNNNGTTTVYLVRRTCVSGSPEDFPVAQSDWNIDKFDGTGASGITLNLAKAQILLIDLQWLGVGRVRVGFDISGHAYWVHEFVHANSLSSVYMCSASLPVRYEVVNTGTATGTLTMDTICACVLSEGASEKGITDTRNMSNAAISRTLNNGAAGGAFLPVVAGRVRTTALNATVNHGQVILVDYSIMVTGTTPIYYELRLNATVNSATWSQVSTLVDQNTNIAATMTNGLVIDSGYLPGSAQQKGQLIHTVAHNFPLVYTDLGQIQDTFVLCAVGIGGTSTVVGEITYSEYY